MSIYAEAETPLPCIQLTVDEGAEVHRLAHELCDRSLGVDDPRWVSQARAAWEHLPASLRRSVRGYRRRSGSRGTLLLKGLPVGEDMLPLTPSDRGSVQKTPSISSATLLMVASGLGDPAAFLAEKSGALVQDVVPVPGLEEFQGNAGSVSLLMHNENAFHDHRPDFVMLLCLRADHDGIAGLRTSCIREALPLLDEGTLIALSSLEFCTQRPPSFGNSEAAAPIHAVLSGAPEDPDVRVDFAATQGTTPRAKEALVTLQTALDAVSRTVELAPGDLAVVDNRVALHGRTAFQPRYDGQDRWLQRTFVLGDLWKSRDYRPQDGYVLNR
ncbi:TauD/TfdA family dioxygenase [Streptomyces virginiae]|uniref:TauD/TfdA family dioxygenase n=1 Tax=Streptomyces virginiae TaxID=1961 RepID=UPI003248C320